MLMTTRTRSDDTVPHPTSPVDHSSPNHSRVINDDHDFTAWNHSHQWCNASIRGGGLLGGRSSVSTPLARPVVGWFPMTVYQHFPPRVPQREIDIAVDGMVANVLGSGGCCGSPPIGHGSYH